jgi:hypothetical protein
MFCEEREALPQCRAAHQDKDRMNFLLYMLGRGCRSSPSTRPMPREVLFAQAARLAADADLPGALRLYDRLASSGRSPMDLLIRGHLHLLTGDPRAASHDFARGAQRLLSRCDDPAACAESTSADAPADTSVERLMARAHSCLQRGRFVRAADILHETRRLLDVLLSAQTALFVAELRLGKPAPHHPATLAPLLPLARLGDIALRLLARTHLAAHLADSLRQRKLRDDLATWATTAQSIDALLASEFQRLLGATRAAPAIAEGHFRLGLIARVVSPQRLDIAHRAFSHTLALHPSHISSAALLAAGQLQRNESIDSAAIDTAFTVSPAMLKTYAAFAQASTEPAPFDTAVDLLCADLPSDALRTAARANLAFALSELSILDPARAAWREAVPA